jgi:uncharacterized protein (DUF934 family)
MSKATQNKTTRLWTRHGFRRNLWNYVADEAPVPTGFAIISLQRWRNEKTVLALNPAITVGVHVSPDDTLDPDTDEIHRLDLIALAFPRFTDGRAYSTVRRLREQWEYKGELRATGDVLFDQMPLMIRCGFNTFQINDAATIRALSDTNIRMPERMYQRLPTTHHTKSVPTPGRHTRRALATAE